ncbi:MAG: sulfatase [Planctomycetota bacterium]|nr:sulfatase [Planctomycetota bacterium]
MDDSRLLPACGPLAVLLLFGGALFLPGCGDGGADKPNLLLVTMDTTRADHLASYGYPIVTTPRVDGLAARGVLIERAYAPMAQTLPSHATLFTGVEPRVHGALENSYRLSPDLPTLAEILEQQGYETAAVVGALALSSDTGLDRGFQSWSEPQTDTTKGPNHPAERPASEVTDEALAWILGRGEEPFFLWVHYYDPHGPFRPPPGFLTTLERSDVQKTLGKRLEEVADAPVAFESVVDTWHGYDAELEYMDSQIGRLLDGLEDRNLLDHTAIALVADHGEGLWEHGEKGHGVNVFEELVHVPLIFVEPESTTGGSRVSEPVRMSDVLPTLLSLVGVSADQFSLEGRDVLSSVGSESSLADRPVFLERPHYSPERLAWRNPARGPVRYHYGVFVGVLAEGYKLVRDVDGTESLYDLNQDPAESVDLSKSDPQRREKMSGLLDEWLARHPIGAPGEATDLSEERAEQLRQLGYGGGPGGR